MKPKTKQKKVAKAGPVVLARKDLQHIVDVLQTLTAVTVGGKLLIKADYEVKVVSNGGSGHEVLYLDTSGLPVPVRRGRPGKGSVSAERGDSIKFSNTTKHQVTLTFCEDNQHSSHSTADQEFPDNPLTLGSGGSAIETLTDKRAGKKRQQIWVKIEWTELNPGSAVGGGPDMEIDDPTP